MLSFTSKNSEKNACVFFTEKNAKLAETKTACEIRRPFLI